MSHMIFSAFHFAFVVILIVYATVDLKERYYVSMALGLFLAGLNLYLGFWQMNEWLSSNI